MNFKRLINNKKRLYDGYKQTYRFFRISDDEIESIENLKDPKIVNEVFNEFLQEQINGTLQQGFVYQLGMPSEQLKSSGVKDLPIELSSRKLSEKSMQDNHTFNLNEIFDLPDAIQNPLAVFRSATVVGAFVVLTKLKHDGKNFVAAIHINRNKKNIEVNDIRSIHYRTLYNIVDWITEGLGEYFCPNFESEWFDATKKELLSKQQYQPVEVRKQLNIAANVIREFGKTNDNQ